MKRKLKVTKKPKHMGRPMVGKQARITRSIRIEPSKKIFLETRFGTIQKWFDEKLKEEMQGIHEAVIIPRKNVEQISMDDF